MNLRNLKAQYMRLNFHSLFDAYVHVTDTLTADLYYKGNVYYTGKPVIQVQRRSDGRLISF